MKKIINGKVYNTETAVEVGYWSNGQYLSDFSYMREALYRKKTGEYFLFGEGGAMSRYAKSFGDCWGYGEEIMPLSYEAAQKWAEEKLTGDEYEEIFGEVTEDESRKINAYNLATTSIEKLKRMSEKQGRSASEILDELIKNA